MNMRLFASVAVVCLLAGVAVAVQQSDRDRVGNELVFEPVAELDVAPQDQVQADVQTNDVFEPEPGQDTASPNAALEGVTLEKLQQAMAEAPYESIEEALKSYADKNYEEPEPFLAEADRQIPSFALASLDNSEWSIDSLQGKPWVINFWATWCPPCIEELPSMNAAFDILEPQGVGMLAINAGEGADAVGVFLQKVAIDFPNVLGDGNTLPNWSVRALPTTIVIDAEGNVVYEAIGPREWDDPRLLYKVLQLL